MLLHNSYMCKPPRCITLWYLVLQRRLDGRLCCVYKVLLRWQLHGILPAPAVKHVLKADVPVNYQTTITCVQNATFRHHFRTPCFSQGPPSPRPHLLLSLGVANKSFPTPPLLSTRLPPNSLIGSFCWATPTFSNRTEREFWQSNKKDTQFSTTLFISVLYQGSSSRQSSFLPGLYPPPGANQPAGRSRDKAAAPSMLLLAPLFNKLT